MNRHKLFLGLGSNLGNKKKNIELAYEQIEKRIGTIVSRSAFYVTEPDGFVSDNDFENTVCEVDTGLLLNDVFGEVLDIENIVGRTSKSVNGVYSDRIIDIDILMYDDVVVDTEGLSVPHPRFHERDFVLIPFSEISPDTVHPILNRTISELKSFHNN